MFSYIWPILLVVLSNTVYQICAKGVPSEMNPFASLVITYLVGAAVSFVLFLVLGGRGSILAMVSCICLRPRPCSFSIPIL